MSSELSEKNGQTKPNTLLIGGLFNTLSNDNKDRQSVFYSDDSSIALLDVLSMYPSIKDIIAAFSSLLSTVIYRYTYQTEFELQYLTLESDHFPETEIEFKRLSFNDATQLSFDELNKCTSKELANFDDVAEVEPKVSQSQICIVELNQPLTEAITQKLSQYFNHYQGIIWPVIVRDKEKHSLHWLTDTRISSSIIQLLQQHLQQLFDSVQEKPSNSLSQHRLLSDQEIEQQLLFSKGKVVSESKLPLYKLIEAYAVSQPNKTAVIFGQEKLSYQTLNRAANKLAEKLVEKKVAIGSHVVVYIEPSQNILISMLAIHKVGGVYIPIDPNFPAHRVAAIFIEVEPIVILHDGLNEDLSVDMHAICLKIEVSDLSGEFSDPQLNITLNCRSHIFFTSGTTGRPKGVIFNHRNLTHYIDAAIDSYDFNSEDTFIAAARFTFSISMFELLTPLVLGGTVHLVTRAQVLNLNQLVKIISTVTAFHFGPSLLKVLLPYIEANFQSFKQFESLRHVSSGGDMVPPEVLEKLKRIFTKAEVFVIYGSSEISCMGCTFEVSRDSTITKTLVGRPHQNMKVRLFDEERNMIPLGVIGEIYFSGVGVATGYLNLPELTNEKFTQFDGERYYSIGDVGRLDTDGNLALLGRKDYQVQVNGMRIELLEVEACIKKYPDIEDCVVTASADGTNDNENLVAYVVINSKSTILACDLTSFIEEYLPDYMIPSTFVSLDALPTNHNSKLDRSLLPKPTISNMLLSAEFRNASTEVEQVLVKMWASMFNLPNIGIDHDFFELGGNSLLAVNFLMDVDRRFEKFIPIAILMESPTIREIALIIVSDANIEGVGDVVVLKKGNSEPPLFCLYGVLLYKNLAETIQTDRMVCGVYLQEEIDILEEGQSRDKLDLFSDVREIVKRYVKVIKSFQLNGPYYLTGHSFGGLIALEVARALEAMGDEVNLIAMLDTRTPRFYEKLSKTKRLLLHLEQLKLNGFSYLTEKILKKFKIKKSGSGSEENENFHDIRGELRNVAAQNYTPEKYSGNVLLIKAKERTAFEPDLAGLGWDNIISELEVFEVTGVHEEILKLGNVETIAGYLEERIND